VSALTDLRRREPGFDLRSDSSSSATHDSASRFAWSYFDRHFLRHEIGDELDLGVALPVSAFALSVSSFAWTVFTCESILSWMICLRGGTRGDCQQAGGRKSAGTQSGSRV